MIDRQNTELAQEALGAMNSAEPIAAISAVQRLNRSVLKGQKESVNLDGCWDAFKSLLDRRGYLVSTPSGLAGALNEIHALGEEFDLFDLAQAMAELDTTLVDCLGLKRDRAFPEISRFSPRCPCDTHPAKGSGGKTVSP